MLIAIIDHGTGAYQTNLTDMIDVLERRQHPDAGAALARVHALMRLGHTPAFPSAYADLRDEAEADHRPAA